MQLKSLELRGFKSFPHKTQLNFDPGMTVIIGPNGSGKSNISDAIRWVMGEASSKSLRGVKMEDIIFGGTDRHSPMGYAEVSLVFDNRDGALPYEYDEVSLTRKYYRSGESEYMINRKQVRLKDIVELLLNTGLGKSGYSIVSQGQIADIISRKSEDRRGIFEESAGIARYRYKKNEAERKLIGVQDNLARVDDIIGELAGRIEPLEAEAAKARQYLELYEARRAAEVSLLLYEVDHIKQNREGLERDYGIAAHELELCDGDITTLEGQQETLVAESHENHRRTEGNAKLATELRDRKHENASSIMLLERDVEFCGRELERIAAESETLSKRLASGDQEEKRLGEERLGGEEKHSELKSQLAAAEANLGEIRESLYTLQSRRSELETERTAALERVMSAKLELSTAENAQSNQAVRLEEIHAEIETSNERINSILSELSNSQNTLADYDARLAVLDDKLTKGVSEQQSLGTMQTKLNNEANALRGKQAQLQERAGALSRIREHFEGFAGSVKSVMQSSLRGELHGICGPVSELISAKDAAMNTALETALGSSIQNIIVENETSAKSAMALLKERRGGRATFYPLSTMSSSPLNVDTSRLSASVGFVGIASDIVHYDTKYAPVIKYLLGRTVIADNIDNATNMAREFGYKFKIVTTDGQVINAGGSFTGGSTKTESGILSRNSEISRLEQEGAEVSASLSNLTEELAQLDAKLKAVETATAGLTEERELTNLMRNTADTQHRVLLARHESEAAALLTQTQARDSLLDTNAKSDLVALQSAITDAENQAETASANLAALEVEITATSRELDICIDEKNRLAMAVAAAEKDIAMLAREVERLAQSKSEAAEQIANFARQTEGQIARRKRAVEEIATLTTAAQGIENEIAALEQSGENLRNSNMELEIKIEAVRGKIREKTRTRETLFREFTRLSTRLETIGGEQDTHMARLWDEYNLTYATAVELGYPPVTAESKQSVSSAMNRARTKLRELGNVNVGAIEEYAEVRERYDFLTAQADDLKSSRDELTEIIVKLEYEMRMRFKEAFERINEHFKETFVQLFGGGSAELALLDEEDILNCGIEINVAPPGKIVNSLSLLSGGEQVFVAIALLFAVQKVNPAPFCFLDEIDAALDEVNIGRFAAYAKRASESTQYIIISHRRGTMEEADTLLGVTMQERGISRVLSLNVNEVEAKLGKIG